MYNNIFPTKANLISAKNTLKLSKQGYKLLDKKRSVLIKEIMNLNKKAYEIQNAIHTAFEEAYNALKKSNIEVGSINIEYFSYSAQKEENISINTRSVMGVEIPIVTYSKEKTKKPILAFDSRALSIEEAYEKFNKVKELIIELSIIENSAYRLAINIKKTQKRANALKNITIPKFENITKEISDVLEERERDEFTRLKVIKNIEK